MVKNPLETAMRLRWYQRLRGLASEELGAELAVTGVAVSRYFSGARSPRRKVSDRLKTLTHGVIHAGNYAEEVTAQEAAEMMAEIERRAAAGEGDIRIGAASVGNMKGFRHEVSEVSSVRAIPADMLTRDVLAVSASGLPPQGREESLPEPGPDPERLQRSAEAPPPLAAQTPRTSQTEEPGQ